MNMATKAKAKKQKISLKMCLSSCPFLDTLLKKLPIYFVKESVKAEKDIKHAVHCSCKIRWVEIAEMYKDRSTNK